jgi:hypothetical protein
LILGGLAAALGENGARSDQKHETGSGEVAHNRLSWIKHPTHTFPDYYRVTVGVLPPKWVPNAAETPDDSHAGYLGFCPANSQLYRVVVKSPQGRRANPAIVYPDRLLADRR